MDEWHGQHTEADSHSKTPSEAHARLHASGIAHSHPHSHSLAYGVGAVHGLAGSGTLVLLVMSNITGAAASMLYLFNFGVGSMGGMLFAASIFSLPFSKRFSSKISSSTTVQRALTFVSAATCICYGAWIIFSNLIV
jgi:hypothetical protein